MQTSWVILFFLTLLSENSAFIIDVTRVTQTLETTKANSLALNGSQFFQLQCKIQKCDIRSAYSASFTLKVVKQDLEITRNEEDFTSRTALTHDDLIWELGLPEDASKLEKLKQTAAARLLRASFVMSGKTPPRLLCPKTGKAFLSAKLRSTGEQIGRFGITTSRGPPCREIDDCVKDLFGWDFPGVGTGAIIYMFVNEAFRKRQVGSLALEVISAIQAARGISFTVLVADDDGSNNLVRWYESQPTERQFKSAPTLQNILGSPGGKYGITMIAPTSNGVENGMELLDRIEVKYW